MLPAGDGRRRSAGEGGRDHRQDNAANTGGRYALELADNGGRGGCEPFDRAACLAGQRFEAAPGQDLQGLERPRFAEKLVDIVGLYLNPPEHALVLSCDEKSQIQALDRTRRACRCNPGRLETMTHDYKRNGTTTLFAAIDVAQRQAHQQMHAAAPPSGVAQVSERIDAETPAELDLHLIVDNYATHKHPKVQAWLKRHPALPHALHPDEQFVAEPDRTLVPRHHRPRHSPRRVPERRSVGAQRSRTISNHHNARPKSFMWTAKAEEILEKVRRARAALDKIPTE